MLSQEETGFVGNKEEVCLAHCMRVSFLNGVTGHQTTTVLGRVTVTAPLLSVVAGWRSAWSQHFRHHALPLQFARWDSVWI